MSPVTVGILGLVLVFILLASQMPVGFSMALVGLVGFVYLVSVKAGLSMVAMVTWTTFASYDLSVIPLFVLMGQFAFESGVSKRLYDSAHTFFGAVRGSLAMATVGACAGFAAVCGSSVATVASMGTVALPEMTKHNYDPSLAAGSVAAGGSMGILIPPSALLILYAIMTEQSIGELFAAGVLPGLLEAILYLLVIYILCKWNPSLGPRGQKTSFKAKLKGIWGGSIETFMIFIFVLGGLFAGWFTPTEAAAVGAAAVLVMGISYRRLTWKGLTNSVYQTALTAGMIFTLLLGAMILNRFIALSQIPFVLAEWVATINLPRMIIMLMLIFVYVIGGCFIDAMGLILLTVPIFFPIVVSLGFSPVWFGVVIARVTEMAMITPPVGVNVYILKGVAKDIPLEKIFRGILPFVVADVFEVILLLAFPQIVLFLPSIFRY
jgi:tripartite ATP-independent transporter DctM subunit